MAQQVVGQKTSLNPGSRTVTHKTMGIKSNTKGVPVTPVTQPIEVHKEGQSVSSKKIPNHKNVGTHY